MQRVLYAASERGVHLLVEGEGGWKPFHEGLQDRPVTCVAARDVTALAGAREGIFRSTDGGRSWQESGEGLTIPHVRWIAWTEEGRSRAFAGTEPAGLFVSDDEGGTWRGCEEVERLRDRFGWSLPYSPEAGCVRGFACRGDRAYAAVEQGGILRSDDGGSSWSLVEGSTGRPESSPPPGGLHADVHSVEIHPSSPDRVFAATGGGLYRSKDGGKSWVCLYPCYCRAFWLDPGNAGRPDPDETDRVILGSAEGVARNGRIEESLDGGQTWRPGSSNLRSPWPEQMVERFVTVGERLVALLSTGSVLVESPRIPRWEPILGDIEGITGLAVVET